MNTLFVGSGSIGKRHIRNLAQVCAQEATPLHLELLRSGRQPLPEDIEAAVSRCVYDTDALAERYDAVWIANPTHLHYDTICALKHRANKFFVEKPLFDTLTHPPEEMGLPAENLYYVACPLRYTGVLQYAKTFFRTRMPFSIRAISSSYLPDWRPGVDYRQTYSAHAEQGGGVCIDLIHEWDYLSDLFGFPLEVQKSCGRFSQLEITSDDLACYIARYPRFLAEVHLDYFGRCPERKLEAWLEDGKYTFDILNGRVCRNDREIAHFDETPNDKYLAELRYFLSLTPEDGSANDLGHAYTVQRLAT